MNYSSGTGFPCQRESCCSRVTGEKSKIILQSLHPGRISVFTDMQVFKSSLILTRFLSLLLVTAKQNALTGGQVTHFQTAAGIPCPTPAPGAGAPQGHSSRCTMTPVTASPRKQESLFCHLQLYHAAHLASN